MQIEPKTIAAQARLLAGMIDEARLDGRELAVRQLRDAARRLDALADDPGGEVIVEGVVPAHAVNEWGEALPGSVYLDAA